MIKLRITNLITVLNVGLLLAGCSQESADSKWTAHEKQPIVVSCCLQEGDRIVPFGATRADVHPALKDGFKLCGFYTNVDMPTDKASAAGEDGTNRFFDWTQVSTRDGNYSYEGGTRYWAEEATVRHSYCAYAAPAYTESNQSGVIGTPKGLTTTDFHPYLEFQQSLDPAKQIDLLVAYGPMNLLTGQSHTAVNMVFKHALSKLVFKLISIEKPLYNCEPSYTLSVTNADRLKNKANIDLIPSVRSGASSSWSEESISYPLLKEPVFVPASDDYNDKDNAVTLGELLLIPQSITYKMIKLGITHTKTEDVNSGAKSPIEITLPEITLTPSMQTTIYLAYIPIEAKILVIKGITVEPWGAVELTVDKPE